MRKRYILVGLFSVLPHLYGISSPPLDYHKHRQTNTAAIARNYHENGLHLLNPQISWDGDNRGRAATELPLYMYLVGVLWGVFGLGALWGRVLSVFFSACTTAAFLRFLEGWLDERSALCAAILFAWLPVEIYFGRTIQPESFALLCSILSLLFLDRYLSSRLAGRVCWSGWAFSWAAAAVAIGHKLPYGYLLAVCGVLAWLRLGRAALRDPGVLAFIPLVLLPVFAWYKYASSGVYVVPTSWESLLLLLEYSRLPHYLKAQFLTRFPELTVTWPGMVLWAAGAWGACRTRAGRLLWLWLACICVYAVLGGAYTFHHEYTALPFALVNSAFMGLGLRDLLDRAAALRGAWRRVAFAGLAVVIVALPLNAAYRIKHWYRIEYPYLVGMDRIADRISDPNDLFLCDMREPSVPLFFLRRRGWSDDLWERGLTPMEWIAIHLPKGARFFMVRKGGPFADRADPLCKPVFDRYPLVYEGPGAIIFRIRT